jgi:deoxyribodipyrimidine photo-lyase
MAVTLYWHRHDLRLSDNPALSYAVAHGAVQPVFILDDTGRNSWIYGGASAWWLHHSLIALQKSYADKGASLLLLEGDPEILIPQLAQQINAEYIVWNRRYDPYGITQDTTLKELCTTESTQVKSFNSHLLCEPWNIQTKTHTPYRVFTPFWRALSTQSVTFPPLHDTPDTITPITHKLSGLSIDDLKLHPHDPDWSYSLQPHWQISEEATQTILSDFLDNGATDYSNLRDYPDQDGTSRLSPYLAFGQISPRTIWYSVKEHGAALGHFSFGDDILRQLAWREFSYHLLYHYPHTPTEPLNGSFSKMQWDHAPDLYASWCKGQTGFPLIDAGMRQLWQTGYMHNRVRMVVASFLVKNLLCAWQDGAAWFWDTLVDADLANNTMGWQWVGGCGADAAPFFRIFNPVLQSKKFDAAGGYICRYVPELAKLPEKYIHIPWLAPESVLQQAGVTLGQNYPHPIIDLGHSRDKALSRYKDMTAQKAAK